MFRLIVPYIRQQLSEEQRNLEDQIDWDSVMKEVNSEAMRGLNNTSNEDKERMNREKQEMESRLKALEDQLQAERDRAEKAIGSATDAFKKEQNELQERLQQQVVYYLSWLDHIYILIFWKE